MQKAPQSDQSLASPLKGFHIPAGTKMPQTQADLAVYVKTLLGQMVRSVNTTLEMHGIATHAAAAVRMMLQRCHMTTLLYCSKHASQTCRTVWWSALTSLVPGSTSLSILSPGRAGSRCHRQFCTGQ